jgi:prepilin-type N-terminal cleavage/methylation domain-containing protein
MLQRKRRGYTLFEVVLVMAVLLIASAFAVPSLKNMYGYHKLHGAVDTVRGAWATARAHAINEGRPYRFSVEPGGSHFRIAPDQDDYWQGGSGPENDQHGKAMVLERALPSGVQFSVGSAPDAPASAAPANSSGDTVDDEKKTKASGQWNTGAVFLPNGTARDDVKITFQVRGVRPITLQLRALTGSVTAQTAAH